VIFDLSHREIFSPLSTAEMGYSDFSKSLSKAGYTVEANKQPLTTDTLAAAKMLILAGPMTEFTDDELKSITDFVSRGGDLLIMTHVSETIIALAEKFDIQPSLAVISETENLIENSPQDFYATDLSDHPVTLNMKKLALFGTWGLRTRDGGSAKILARTSKKAWADLNKDMALSKDEPQEAYGIVAVAQIGEGQVVVCADDAPLINKFLELGDNRQFGENVISWFENKSI